MRLKLNKKEENFFNKNIKGLNRFFENIVAAKCIFPGFYLVICTSDLNSMLGIYLVIYNIIIIIIHKYLYSRIKEHLSMLLNIRYELVKQMCFKF